VHILSLSFFKSYKVSSICKGTKTKIFGYLKVMLLLSESNTYWIKKSFFSGLRFDEKHCQSKSIMIINWSRESSWETSKWYFFTPPLFIVNIFYSKRFSRMSHLSTTLSELVYVSNKRRVSLLCQYLRVDSFLYFPTVKDRMTRWTNNVTFLLHHFFGTIYLCQNCIRNCIFDFVHLRFSLSYTMGYNPF
jgi:hypothetical protein